MGGGRACRLSDHCGRVCATHGSAAALVNEVKKLENLPGLSVKQPSTKGVTSPKCAEKLS